MDNLIVTIMAGGLGKRMQSQIPKVLHEVAGLPMLVRLLNQVNNLKPNKIIIVVGIYKEIITQTLSKYIDISNIIFANQDTPLGTGHAVLCTLHYLDIDKDKDKINLILNGDNPMLSKETLQFIYDEYVKNNKKLQITAINLDNPTGNGRIIQNNNIFEKIVEEKDCSPEQRNIQLVNCGIYLADINMLNVYIPKIKNNNAQHEYYLTDIVELYKNGEHKPVGLCILDKDRSLEIINVNTKEQLDQLNKLVK